VLENDLAPVKKRRKKWKKRRKKQKQTNLRVLNFCVRIGGKNSEASSPPTPPA
jgi:hypothetical protein